MLINNANVANLLLIPSTRLRWRHRQANGSASNRPAAVHNAIMNSKSIGRIFVPIGKWYKYKNGRISSAIAIDPMPHEAMPVVLVNAEPRWGPAAEANSVRGLLGIPLIGGLTDDVLKP
jgi:hypothetical protein